jgi:GNAT superfamily N-acetyltransferase
MPSDQDAAIQQATVRDIAALTPLFDEYRSFYRQPSEPGRIEKFLLDRFEHGQSVIFLARVAGQAVGFTQLYPSFSSASLARIFILNDLYVAPASRGRRLGQRLLAAAADHARQFGAPRLELSTEISNAAAQRLYERNGWRRNVEFYSYQLSLK